MAGRMGTAIVLREKLNVLMVIVPVDLILDAVVREVELTIEVRQIVVARPLPDLAFVSVRPAVAVGAPAVVLLQELLVLAFQVLRAVSTLLRQPDSEFTVATPSM